MEYIGKEIIRYGDLEFIGDKYSVPIPEDVWSKMLEVISKDDLKIILDIQIEFENYEAAQDIKNILDE